MPLGPCMVPKHVFRLGCFWGPDPAPILDGFAARQAPHKRTWDALGAPKPQKYSPGIPQTLGLGSGALQGVPKVRTKTHKTHTPSQTSKPGGRLIFTGASYQTREFLGAGFLFWGPEEDWDGWVLVLFSFGLF